MRATGTNSSFFSNNQYGQDQYKNYESSQSVNSSYLKNIPLAPNYNNGLLSSPVHYHLPMAASNTRDEEVIIHPIPIPQGSRNYFSAIRGSNLN